MNARIQEAFSNAPPFDTWPDLIPLDEPDLPSIDPSCLPSWAGDFAAALSTTTETPPELAVAMVLAACSTACARRVRLRINPDHFEPANLWILCALPPGNRKSAVQSAAVAPIIDWENEQTAAMKPEIERLTSDAETLRARAREFRNKAAKTDCEVDANAYGEAARKIETSIPEIPRAPQLWTSDATPEHLGTLMANNGERMAWLSSEGGIFDMLGGRYSNGALNLDLTLKAHSGDADRVDRGSRPPIFLRRPLLTIGLSPQPDVLRGLATKPGFRGRGLLARFLYLLPRSNLGYRQHDTPAIPPEVRRRYREGIRAMLSWPVALDEDQAPTVHILHLEPDAQAALLEFTRQFEAKMRPGGDFENATDWAGKAPSAAGRMAVILHCIEYAHGAPWETPVSGATMGQALILMESMERHALAVLSLMGADEGLDAARRVWEWVRRGRRASFTAREAHRALQASFPRMASLMPAIELLEERGYLLIDTVEHRGQGRPRSPTIHVRPGIAGGW